MSLTAEAVADQLIDTEKRLVLWSLDIAAGTVSPSASTAVRDEIDVLTCLLDEAPPSQHQRIHYLIDRCESVAARLSN